MPIHLPPLSRRGFLKATLAAGAAALVPGRLDAGQGAVDPNRVALLADTHVWADPAAVQREIRSVETATAAFGQVLALDPLPAHLFVAGDCAAMAGEPGDYVTLKRLLEPVRKAGIAVHLALGNHDHRENAYAAFPETRPKGKPQVPGKHVGIVKTPRADVVVLDSLDKTNVTPGALGEAQLAWLDKTLAADGARLTLVLAHHYPDRREKPSGLTDTDALFAVLARRRVVQAYIFGHSHRWNADAKADVRQVNVPTTAWVFGKEQPRGWVDAHLEADGLRLDLRALDASHPWHGRTVRLPWRT